MDEARLPTPTHQILLDISSICSEAAAVALVRNYAGQRVYIPQDPPPNHELIRTLGSALALQLSDGFGGETISVPRTFGPGETRDTVLRLARLGFKVRQIATKAGCTEMRVYQILARERKRTGQNPRRPSSGSHGEAK